MSSPGECSWYFNVPYILFLIYCVFFFFSFPLCFNFYFIRNVQILRKCVQYGNLSWIKYCLLQIILLEKGERRILMCILFLIRAQRLHSVLIKQSPLGIYWLCNVLMKSVVLSLLLVLTIQIAIRLGELCPLTHTR